MGTSKTEIIYTKLENILKSIRKCGDAWQQAQATLLCLSMRYKWSASMPIEVLQPDCLQHSGAGLSLRPSSLPPSLAATITMSMTNHGRTSKICTEIFELSASLPSTWTHIYVSVFVACVAARPKKISWLFRIHSFLKLVIKYCYKCVDSKTTGN